MDVINVIKTERKKCIYCMEEHDVSTMRCRNKVAIKDVSVEYDAIYEEWNVDDVEEVDDFDVSF